MVYHSGMAFTVKQLADLAGVSVRTLHYYDQIGLLKPSAVGKNGYRRYQLPALLRLQQILFFREMGFPLKEIQAILSQPDFDLKAALMAHKKRLAGKVARLNWLIQTIDQTMEYLEGNTQMANQDFFEGFSQEKQKAYEQEIRERFGEKAFEGVKDWNAYSPQQQAKIKAEGEAIWQDLAAAMPQGFDSPAVQAIIVRWHQHLGYFYQPSPARLAGLADLYNDHPDFKAKFQAIHPDLPEFARRAIRFYLSELA